MDDYDIDHYFTSELSSPPPSPSAHFSPLSSPTAGANSSPLQPPGIPEDTENVALGGDATPSTINYREVRRKEGQQKRLLTMRQNQAQRDAARHEDLMLTIEENLQAKATAEQDAAARQDDVYRSIIDILEGAGLTWGDFVEWVSKPGPDANKVRFSGLFQRRQQVVRILDLWATRNSRYGRRVVHDWALEHIGKVVSNEAAKATRTGVLMSKRMSITETFVLSFDLARIHSRLRELCPSMTALLMRFSTSKRQEKEEEKPTKSARERAVIDRRTEKKHRVREPLLFRILIANHSHILLADWCRAHRSTV